MSDTRAKLRTIIADLESQFVQRQAVIRSLVLAALAREHVLLLGPPGTGKSALARAFADRLEGGEHFEWLLSKFSQPEELFGPVSIAGLKSDSFRRVTTGKLPCAHTAFLDEIFKANSAILNALLTAVNERVFHNGATVEPIPLRTVIGASNELPAEDGLAAFFDRFLVRHWIAPIAGHREWCELMAGGGVSRQAPTTRLTLDEWEAACAEVDAVTLSPGAVESAYGVKIELERADIVVSDRRWLKAFRLAKAAAWLEGEPEVAEEDCGAVWGDVLWNEPDQRDAVRRTLNQLACGELVQAREVYDALSAKLSEIEALTDFDRFAAKAPAINNDGRRAVNELLRLFRDVRGERAKREIQAMGREAKARVKAVRDRLVNSNDFDDKVTF